MGKIALIRLFFLLQEFKILHILSAYLINYTR